MALRFWYCRLLFVVDGKSMIFTRSNYYISSFFKELVLDSACSYKFLIISNYLIDFENVVLLYLLQIYSSCEKKHDLYLPTISSSRGELSTWMQILRQFHKYGLRRICMSEKVFFFFLVLKLQKLQPFFPLLWFISTNHCCCCKSLSVVIFWLPIPNLNDSFSI